MKRDPRGAAEEHLILYESNGASDAFRAAMQDVAARVRPWTRIVWAGDLLDNRGVFGHKNHSAYVNELRNRIDVSNTDELWFGKLTTCPEHLVSDLYPSSPIFLYEDGFGSYAPHVPHIDQLTGKPLSIPRRLLKLAKGLIEDQMPSRRYLHFSARYLRRVAGIYGFIAHEVPIPEPFSHEPLTLIDKDVVRDVLAQCESLPDVVQAVEQGAHQNNAVSAPPTALVLPQTFYKWRVLSRQQEADIYKGVVSSLLERGYVVLWKEHPPRGRTLYPDMARAFGAENVRSVSLPFTLPIEFIAPFLKVDAWVAAGSSSLYYLSRIYGERTYTFAEDFIPYLSGNARTIAQITSRLVPSLAEATTPSLTASRGVDPVSRDVTTAETIEAPAYV